MESIVESINRQLPLFLLVFLRMSGLFILSPVFGRRNVPAVFKIGLGLLLSIILIQGMGAGKEIDAANLYAFAFLCMKELLVGFVMGYVTTLFFSALMFAGQIMDIQIGFGMAQIFDPQYNAQVPLLGNFMNMLALLVFFTLDGHLTLIRILFASYDVIPPGMVMIKTVTSQQIAQLFGMTFAMAVKIAIPVIAAALLSEAALGVMVRAVPQMNVFVVGIPLKIFVTLVILLVFIPVYIRFLSGTFDTMFSEIRKVLLGMGAAPH